MERILLVVCLMVFVLTSAGCENSSSPSYYVNFMVINKTNLKFTHVNVVGDGYPGSFGNCVAGSNSVMSGTSTAIGSQAKVSWVDHRGQAHEKSFQFSQGVVMSENMHVILQFSANGDVVLAISKPEPNKTVIEGIMPDSTYADVVENGNENRTGVVS